MHGTLTSRSCRLALVAASLFAALAATASAQAQTPCAECHDTVPEAFSGTVHGFLECSDCHADIGGADHPEGVVAVDCGVCHEDLVAEYDASAHGRTRNGGSTEAPACADCHGSTHELVPIPDPKSPVHHARLAETCGACHANPEVASKFGIRVARPFEAYEASVHARVVAAGGNAATCSDCHGSHGIRGAGDPESKVFHQTVPDTCGTCHAEIAEAYRGSVHGQAASHGVREAPVCTDCHGEHRILSPQEPGSPVFATNVPKVTCGRCHGDVRLAEKFGIDADKVPAYEDSYHGLASRAGIGTVAHCGSCHGVHDILPSTDPRSHVHPANLAGTCGSCHPGAGTKFAIGSVHVLPTDRQHAAVYYIRQGYLWVIYVTIGGMVVHNLLDFARKMKSRPVRPIAPVPSGEQRMLLGFRIAHALLIVSFVSLAYTGFALKYPDAWWARPLQQWEDGLGLRGWLHRVAAVVMIASLAVHVAHLALERRARACIARMRPKMEDVRELRERLAYYFGLRKRPPEVPELGYPEKLEYIALMWGIVIMSVTGFALWLDDIVLKWLPKWVSDVATVIHFYEAVLATLAIVVWHFYFVIFDPVVYPMDTAWLTGRAPLARVLERGHTARTAPRERKAPSAAPARGGETPPEKVTDG